MSSDSVTEFWQERLKNALDAGQSSVRRLNEKIVEIREDRANLQMQLGRALEILKANSLLCEFCQDD